MKTVSKMLLGLLGVGLASFGNVSLAQDQDFSAVEIQTVPVAENI